MRLAVVGSRDYPNKKEVWEFLKTLQGKGVSLVTGDARGVDEWVSKGGEVAGITVEVFKADWDGPLGKAAGFARNEELVKHCDKLVAFWDVASTGTAHSIRLALMAGKLAKIVTPFGVLKPEGQAVPSESQSKPSEEPSKGPEPGEPEKVAESKSQPADRGAHELIWNRLDAQEKIWQGIDSRVSLLEKELGVKT